MTTVNTPSAEGRGDLRLLFTRNSAAAEVDPAFTFVMPTIMPLFILIVFTAIYADIAKVDGFPTEQFIDWVAPGALFLPALMGAGFGATGLIADIQSGYLDRLRLLPINPNTVVTSRVAFDAARVVPPTLVIIAVSLAFGADNQAGPLGLAYLTLMAVGLAVAWNGLFYIVALRTKSGEAVQGLFPMFLPLLMLSTFWVPDSFMPTWIRTIATYNPLSQLINASRGLMLEGFDTADRLMAWAVIAATIVITQTVINRQLRQLLDQ